MVTRALFFDSVGGDRVYDAEDWELLFGALVNDGMVPDIDGELLVEPSTPTAMSVVVNTGRAFVNGKLVEVTANETLTIGANGSGSTRHDLVVARIDYGTRIGSLAVVPGTAGAGSAPAPQQDTARWEIPLAEVAVANGAVDIKLTDLTDRRVSAVSGVGVPSGVIMLWSGSTATIPAGWNLCDGSNGTPDLRGRFVVGAGGTYNPGATGGADTVTLTAAQMPSHTHSGPSHSHAKGTLVASSGGGHIHTIPSEYKLDTNHFHSNSSAGAATVPNAGTGSTFSTNGGVSQGAHPHTVTGSTAEAGTGNTGSAGSGSSHENRPPYYALAYIMKS